MHCTLRRAVIVSTFILASLYLASCKKKEEAPASVMPTVADRAAPAPQGAAAKGEAAPQETKRKVILNHSVSLEVKEFPAALEALTRLAESSGGYVFKSNRNSHDRNNSWGEVSIRVPASKAGSVMTSIRQLGRVESENSTAEDITEQYVDLEARLKNARSSEARITELFRRAGELADVLEVERELTRVRGDIEALEAKKKNWDLLVEMVTIEVRLSENSSGFPSINRLLTPIKNGVGDALVGFADSLRSLITFLCYIIPWLAVFGPIAYLYGWKRRKKGQRAGSSAMNDKTLNGENGDDHLP